jgi:hypothetical protein
MTKLASIFVNYTSSAFFAKNLVRDLLRELSEDPSGILDRLKACLSEVEKVEEEEKKEESRLLQKNLDAERDLQYRRQRAGPWWDKRDELDYRPNA